MFFLFKTTEKLVLLPRTAKKLIIVCFDYLLLVFAIWSSYAIRFGTLFVPNDKQLLIILAVPVITIVIFLRLNVYRAVLRYIGEGHVITIFKAMALAALVFGVLAYYGELQNEQGVPRTIPILFLILGTVFVASSRFVVREFLGQATMSNLKRTRVVVCGIGNSAHQLISALKNSTNLLPVAVIDCDRANYQTVMQGLPVYDSEQLATLVNEHDVSRIIICSDAIGGKSRRSIAGDALALGMNVEILPPIADIAIGMHLIDQLRQFNFTDLLGRKAVPADRELLSASISGNSVLITGAGGFIGSELALQIAALNPKRLVLFDISEYSLYEIDRKIRSKHDIKLQSVLGSMSDKEVVISLFAGRNIDTVFHAAAYKHVPLLEENVIVAARNNIFGTLNMVTAAKEAGVERFVLISSDKAVHPTNVMGATKRWAEIVVRSLHEQSSDDKDKTRFCAVRFGNVLNSLGSVVPLFHEQIQNGGPITVTDFGMTRYFMSVGEATDLILQAAFMAKAGDVFLLDMGNPITIHDLAQGMVQLAGLSVRDEKNPGGDIEIVEIGIRPGEKLHEQLFYDPKNCTPTLHPAILRGDTRLRSSKSTLAALRELEKILEVGDIPAIKKNLFEFIKYEQHKQI